MLDEWQTVKILIRRRVWSGSNCLPRPIFPNTLSKHDNLIKASPLRKHPGSAPENLVTVTKTYLYNFDPLKPHFYIVKLGFTGVYIIFIISAQNIDCGYSLEPPRWGGSNEYPQSICFEQKYKKYQNFLSEKLSFLVVKFSVYLNRRVFVMQNVKFLIVLREWISWLSSFAYATYHILCDATKMYIAWPKEKSNDWKADFRKLSNNHRMCSSVLPWSVSENGISLKPLWIFW